MKILFIVNHIYSESNSKYQHSKNGYTIMVKEIADSVSSLDNVSILTNAFYKQDFIEKIKILPHTKMDFFCSIRFKDILRAIRHLFNRSLNLSQKMHNIYYILDNGATIKRIKELNPDIVHIHDTGYKQKECIALCRENKFPYLLTLHLLIGNESNNNIKTNGMEKEILELSEQWISTVSTGILKRAKMYYAISETTHIEMIPNCIPQICCSGQSREKKFFDAEKIPEDAKVALCIGNISPRKNQIQLARVFARLKSSTVHLIFLGKDYVNGEFKAEIEKCGAVEKIHFAGFVDRGTLGDFYQRSDYNLIVSRNEGLGLSAIEGLIFGIPTLMYADLDASEDLYDEKTTALIQERSDEALEEALVCFFSASWDRDYIKSQAERFSSQRVAEKYNTLYKKITAQ